MKIQIKRLRGETLPSYETAGAAAMDLRAECENAITLAPGERALVPTGIAIALPAGYVGLVFARSGLAVRHGIALANGVGVIDSDYRGEICAALVNLGSAPFEIKPGERVAQLSVFAAERIVWEEVSELGGTDRGAGGFGSTGR